MKFIFLIEKYFTRTETQSRLLQTSKMERFAEIVNGLDENNAVNYCCKALNFPCLWKFWLRFCS